MQQGTDVSTPKDGYYPRPTRAYQTAHTTWAYIHAWRRELAVRWYPYWLYIRATVLPSPKGVRGNVLAMGCARYPPKLSPPGIARGAEGGMADFHTTSSRAAPTSLPERCFASHYARSMDELSGRTTVRLGHDGPVSAYAIGGTAKLALRYSN